MEKAPAPIRLSGNTECKCPNCGYNLEASPGAKVGLDVIKDKRDEMLMGNEGDCDLPYNSSEDEENTLSAPIRSVKSQHPKKVFTTNLANNRWIKGRPNKKNQNRPPLQEKKVIPVATLNLVEEMRKVKASKKKCEESLVAAENSFETRPPQPLAVDDHPVLDTPPAPFKSY